MTLPTKIVVIGAGSPSFGENTTAAKGCAARPWRWWPVGWAPRRCAHRSC